jgi:hypothetical protein
MTFLDEQELEENKINNPDHLWNIFTYVLGGGTVLIAILFVWIFFNPQAGINPYPPVIVPPPVQIPTRTETPLPSITPKPSKTPLPTATTEPTETQTHTPETMNTPFVIILPTISVEPTLPGQNSTESAYRYVAQPGSPASVSSSIMQPEVGCNWLGVGGQAVDLQGAPIVGLRVQLYGSLQGEIKQATSITGTVNRYGPSGYEIVLSDFPTESKRTLWLQLLDQAGGVLSDKIYFPTFASCDKNLTIINFKQVK